MTRHSSSHGAVDLKRLLTPRAVKTAAVALLFAALAIAGVLGQRHASRQARLDDLAYCRAQLQDALDARRSAALGPTPRRAADAALTPSQAVSGWATKLQSLLEAFGPSSAAASRAEELELRLSEATLEVARQRFSAALATLDAAPQGVESSEASPRDVEAPDPESEKLRLRADAAYDARDWPAALERYHQIVLRQPELLAVRERVAECLLSSQQVDAAHDAYADLARRLQERGSLLMTRLDPHSATQDFNTAATIRLWLVGQGRRELAADLARSFSSCAEALFTERDLDLAAAYFANAIDVQGQLVDKRERHDLAGELADSLVGSARVLLESGKPDDALARLDTAVDALKAALDRGQSELGAKLATGLARRAVVRQARGQGAAAAQDFQDAAERFAALGDFERAARWQERALALAAEASRGDAERRLELYRAGRGLEVPSTPGP